MMLYQILFLSLFPFLVRSQCPQVDLPCLCTPSVYEPVSIVCDNAGSLQTALDSIARARDVQIDSLTVSNTPIQSLGPSAFAGFTIIRLVLNKNNLNDINENAFEGVIDSLLELDLKENQLGQVPVAGVSRLRNLRKLYLSKNGISRIPASTFNGYDSREMLLKLDLSKNSLIDSGLADPSTFQALRNLEELSLEANALRVVPSMALSNLRRTLKDLNLGLNAISDIPISSLDFPNLVSLSLEFNGISDIAPEAFRGVPNLLYLYLTGNKFPEWKREMFRYIGGLKILGIGETPIRVIPSNAFEFIPSLIRLEMSEAAVDTIQEGAFQRTPNIQAIILNKNKLTVIRASMFQGLNRLYTLDLQGNRLQDIDDFAFANLGSLRHLDISQNNLRTVKPGTFQNTFLQTPDARVLYLCRNPWICDNELDWFRSWLRQNLDVDIDKPNCQSVCEPNDRFPPNWPLRNPDPPTTQSPTTQTGPVIRPEVASSMIGWIILAIILSILLMSICLLGIVRYFVSRKHKKEKDDEMEEEEQRIVSSAASAYNPAQSMVGSQYPVYPASAVVDLDLPQATTLDDRPSYWAY